MSKVKPIMIQGHLGLVDGAQIACLGYGEKKYLPYLSITSNRTVGWVADRDLKKLRTWINACLRAKRRSRHVRKGKA